MEPLSCTLKLETGYRWAGCAYLPSIRLVQINEGKKWKFINCASGVGCLHAPQVAGSAATPTNTGLPSALCALHTHWWDPCAGPSSVVHTI